jgi:hypothetical protein
MNRNNALLPASLIAFALVACQQQNEDNFAIDDTTNVANAAVETLPPDEGNTATEARNSVENGMAGNEAADDSEDSPSTASIPAQYRGRWGMNVNDCDPSRSDAKGLMTVEANRLRFYESVGTLQEQRPAIATSFSGMFSFMGEGQTWERVVTLTRTGDTLKRADSEGSFTYRRCA